jgi:hypothetical protein
MVKIEDQTVSEMMYGGINSFHMITQEGKLDVDQCYTFKVTATKANGLYCDNAFSIRTNEVPHSGK